MARNLQDDITISLALRVTQALSAVISNWHSPGEVFTPDYLCLPCGSSSMPEFEIPTYKSSSA